MKFTSQAIPEVVLIEPQIQGDSRGYFMESFRRDKFIDAIGYNVDFIQDNESKSSRGVLRGLHYQLPPYAQSKLVRVIQGSVLDIAVDIRRGSPTFGRHVALELNEENKYQLFIPRGFAHGFVVLSESALFAYKVDNLYAPAHDRGLSWDDPDLAINWHFDKQLIQLSAKDRQQPRLSEAQDLFDYSVDFYADR